LSLEKDFQKQRLRVLATGRFMAAQLHDFDFWSAAASLVYATCS
jgi:hypothetical protein